MRQIEIILAMNNEDNLPCVTENINNTTFIVTYVTLPDVHIMETIIGVLS